jgi:hypothetical protein
MQIDESHIAYKKEVGKTSKGEPLLYIQSHGGLHAIFKKSKDGSIEAIAASPHLAITKWMAEKAAGKIEWDKDFEENKLTKSEPESQFEKLREIIFLPPLQKSINNNNLMLLYNLDKSTIELLTKDELLKVETEDLCVVRDLALNTPPLLLREFKDNEKEK